MGIHPDFTPIVPVSNNNDDKYDDDDEEEQVDSSMGLTDKNDDDDGDEFDVDGRLIGTWFHNADGDLMRTRLASMEPILIYREIWALKIDDTVKAVITSTPTGLPELHA